MVICSFPSLGTVEFRDGLLTSLMFSVARLSREMYNTFGLFVFGSFVNQLLTDTTKYTIGWF